ncbi:hypothetical protein [Thermococcus sp.]
MNALYIPVEIKLHFDEHFKDPPEFYFHWNRGLEKWMVDAAGYLETGIYKGFYIHPLQILSMPFK